MATRFFMTLGAIYLLVGVVGTFFFLQERADVPFTGDFRGRRNNGRPYANGVEARASTWDWFHQHHVMYAIDGEPRPTTLEKWASVKGDKEPWIEIKRPEAGRVASVQIVHAGRYEDDAYTMRDYSIACLSPSGAVTRRVDVHDNRAAIANHDVDCEQTARVRVAFRVDSNENSPRAVARIYEMTLLPSE